MPNYTKNYNLIKPNKTENYDIEDVTNKNMDILDKELFGKEDKVPGKGPSTNDFTNEYKNKLDGLENYDDTELINKLNEQAQKNNLQEQEIEKLQEQITNLQEENTQLKDQIPNGQATGNPIHIADSTNLEAKLRLNGGSKQETRSNNLYNPETNVAGYLNQAGEIISNNNWVITDYIPVLEALDYYIAGNKNLTDGDGVYGAYYNADKELISTFPYSTYKTETTTITTPENCAYIKFSIYKYQDNTKTFDFYTNAPTPNYQSKVETVGSNINLFNKDDMDVIEGAFINSSTKKIETNVNRKCFYLKISPNKTYTISREKIASNFVVGTTAETPIIGSNIIDVDFNNNEIITITASSNANYLVCYYKTNASDVENEIVEKIKIEEGNKATAYSPYGMGSVEIDVINKNLAEIELGDINPTTGKENAATKVFRSNYIRVKNGATYVWSINKTLTNPLNIRLYDIDKNYIGYASFTSQKTYTITNGDIAYLRVRCDLVGEETIDGLIVQIEEGNTATDIVKHEQQPKIMPIQQEMLEGDYIEDVEHHGWNKVSLLGQDNWNYNFYQEKENTIYFVLEGQVDSGVTATQIAEAMCNRLSTIYTANTLWNNDDEGFALQGNSLRVRINKSLIPNWNTDGTYDVKNSLLRAYLKENNYIFYYKRATPLDLELTEEQKEAQKINTYNNVTNIVADNSLATLDVGYKKDQETLNKSYEDRIAALEAAILS